MDVINSIKNKAKGLNKKIIFPEGDDERIQKAVKMAVKQKMIKPILVNKKTIKESKEFNKYIKEYMKRFKVSEKTAKSIIQHPLFYSTMAVSMGDADGIIGGCVYTSGEMIAVSTQIIGLQKKISVPSSFFLMCIPNFKGGEKGNLIYADASVNPNPTSEELADIAIVSGQTAKNLFKWKPRVAMLSFSTKGSAEHPDVCKVIDATKIANKKNKDKKIKIDGELQADSALILDIAKKKIKGEKSEVAGKANVLIFPDLDAGNISYKLTQRLAKAKAYGPILQGFKKPVSDLSRGASVEDIYGVIAMLCVWSERWKK
jgi:phosphate acetyltransferase